MANKYFIHSCGGLGDHLLGYFYPSCRPYGFGYLVQLKKEQPNAKVKLISHPASMEGPEFFKYHPLIDEIEIHDWVMGIHDCKTEHSEAVELEEYGKTKGWKKRNNTEIFLSKKDKEWVTKVTKGTRPFVVIHPFASEEDRRILPVEEFFPLVNRIISDFKWNVVVLGGSYNRLRNPNKKNIIQEEFPYKRNGLFNFVNKVNGRVGVGLIHHPKCKALIANHSGFWCAASTGKVRLIALHRDPKFHMSKMKERFVSTNKCSVVKTTKIRHPVAVRKEILSLLSVR